MGSVIKGVSKQTSSESPAVNYLKPCECKCCKGSCKCEENNKSLENKSARSCLKCGCLYCLEDLCCESQTDVKGKKVVKEDGNTPLCAAKCSCRCCQNGLCCDGNCDCADCGC